MSYSYKLALISKEKYNENINLKDYKILDIGCPDKEVFFNLHITNNHYHIYNKDFLLNLINYYNQKVKHKYNLELSLMLIQQMLLKSIKNDLKIDKFSQEIIFITENCQEYKNLFFDKEMFLQTFNNKDNAIKLLIEIQEDLILYKREEEDEILIRIKDDYNLGYYNTYKTIIFKLIMLYQKHNFNNDYLILYGD